MDQTQREFLVEIEEHVEHLFADLDELRIVGDAGPARRQLINRIFRRVHSIKGSAATCGLEAVSQIANEFENLLVEVRAGRVLIDQAVVDICESATEALAESLSLAAAGIIEPSRRALFDRLQAGAQTRAATVNLPDTDAILKNVPFEIWESLTEAEKEQLVSIVAEGRQLFLVAASFAIETFDAEFLRFKERLVQLGEVISTSPAVADEPDKINFRVLYAGNTEPQIAAAAVSDFGEVVFQPLTGADSNAEIPAAERVVPTARPSAAMLSNFVRTDLDQVDRLLFLTHNLLRTASTTLDLATSQLTSPRSEEFQKQSHELRSSFFGLEDELINLRLVSLGPTLQRAARAGRAAARSGAKEVHFEISGADLRVDKLLVEAIANPLIHLVRNAVDHGIETEAERTQAGKPARGKVRIEAISEGSQSRLRVADDGRGVDPAFISAAAEELGLFAGPTEIDIEQSLRLIFRPGFTTSHTASKISGRGVGLDVVETAIEQVGGELRVSSKPGQGTTFEIRLPVTFSLISGNVVVSAGQRYCIPAAQTLGIDKIDLVDGASGANQIPQVSMRDLLGQPEEPDDASAQLQLITCQFTEERAGTERQSKCVGIIVDQVEGPQEVLVRSLGRHAGRWYGIAGAAELRDGTVALVLDLPRLLSAPSVSSSW